MILEDMVYELWEQLGRPMKEDLDPTAGGLGAVDATSAGCRRLAKVLDWAQVQVAAWKDPRQGGRPFWWSGAFRTYNQVVSPQVDAVGGAVSGNKNWVRWANPPGTAGVGAVARAAGLVGPPVVAAEDREIVMWNNVDGVAVVYPAFTEVTEGREITLCPRWVDLDRGWRARNVHKVSIMGTGGAMTELVRASRGDQMMQEATVGEPGSWVLKGSRVWLDVALAEERWFKLECEVAPADLVVVADAVTGALDLAVECELPEQFHPLVVLYASAYGQGLLQDVEQQEVRRGQFRNDMMSAVDQAETLLDMDQGLTINVVPR